MLPTIPASLPSPLNCTLLLLIITTQTTHPHASPRLPRSPLSVADRLSLATSPRRRGATAPHVSLLSPLPHISPLAQVSPLPLLLRVPLTITSPLIMTLPFVQRPPPLSIRTITALPHLLFLPPCTALSLTLPPSSLLISPALLTLLIPSPPPPEPSPLTMMSPL